jgi:hypothetical protein
MDLNYLYHRHQISLHLSEHAACDDARSVHAQFATAYLARIEEARRPVVKLECAA